MFIAATAVAAALLIGLGTAAVMFFRERVARHAEQQQRLQAESAQRVAETQQRRADESQRESRRWLYASDMSLAQQSLRLNNLGRARRLLDRHRPQPGEEDLRGWEWRYLWQLTRSSALVTLTNRPTTGGSAVSFSPDGSRLAVGWFDGRVDLWDVTGRRLFRALTDGELTHRGRVAFSPVRNFLAATSATNMVKLYDLDAGRESILWRAPDQGEWHVRDLTFSQDGSRVAIYASANPDLGEAVWVVNVSSAQIEGRHATDFSDSPGGHLGAAQLSPDNRRLYLAHSDSIHCIDLTTDKELWRTEREQATGVTTLALSPDGRVLASCCGYGDPTIRVGDAATGRLLVRLDGHTAWVCHRAFSKDGRRLISAATDQTIRFWDTSTWKESKVLRGHIDEVHAVAISGSAQLVASGSKDGDLVLWKEDGKSATDGYRRLPDDIGDYDVWPQDHSRALLLPEGKPPAWDDLKGGSAPVSLPELGSSTNVLGWFGTNILCQWNGTNLIHVHELRDAAFIQRGAITLNSGMRPTGFTYNPTHQLLAWAEATSSNSVYLASLETPGRRIELKGDSPGLVPSRFSEDGHYLAASTERNLRAWNVETGQIVASIDGLTILDSAFAAAGRVLVVSIWRGNDHEIGFYDLAHPERPPRRVPGRYYSFLLAVSPDGGLVAMATAIGQVRLFDPAKGELIEPSLHGHMNPVYGVAFSPDGRRLISTSLGGLEAVKLWDVGTRQELLTLPGTGSMLWSARWTPDGDVILAGSPWQAWRAPSWEEIATAEAKEKAETKQP